MRLDNRDAENYAGFGIRYNSTVTCETTSRCGYTGILYGDGRWQLLDMDNVAAEGNSMTVRATDWNKLKLLILGRFDFLLPEWRLADNLPPTKSGKLRSNFHLQRL